ncbi:hypothetical protein KM043_008035 [Ampulex compressa]|nr:hypothetical protein KM043_008035 [Ampulex compressa]
MTRQNGYLSHLSMPQIAEHISQCIKLSMENKINVKNAFNLEMIDFMSYMIKKRDTNMSDLQVASTSLDVSTKIYSYRVDGVHTEILKMIGGLDKQDKTEDVPIADAEGQQEEGEDEQRSKKQSQKRKKKKRQIFATTEALRAKVGVTNPASMSMGEGDVQTTDTLYQAKMPNHAGSGFHHHQYDDVVVDIVDYRLGQNALIKICVFQSELSHLDICRSFASFKFQGWSVEDEPEVPQIEERDDSRFQFDLDASLPPDNDHDSCGKNYFDIEDEEENIDRCIGIPNRMGNIVDFRDIVTRVAKPSEYSFVQRSMNVHWAGPSHWKFKNVVRSMNSSSKFMEACRQAANKRRTKVEIQYKIDVKKVLESKFVPSQFAKLHAKTAKTDWNEEKLTLPRDMHYNIQSIARPYLHSLRLKLPGTELDTKDMPDEIQEYDYNNENDTSNYCPDVNGEEYHIGEDNAEENEPEFRFESGCSQFALTGENLVAAPKLASKIAIPYCLRAKKIDMHQLKKSIWKCLVSSGSKENVNMQQCMKDDKVNESKKFSEVYKVLPGMLTKNNTEALSFPIAFVSLLHLANERTLKIIALPDMSDLIVDED